MKKKLAILPLVLFGLNTFAQNFNWAKNFGGKLKEISYGITTDASGNVYTTGNFEGTSDFDPGPGTFNLTSKGDFDIYISKLDSKGNFVWAKSMGGKNEDQGSSIFVDSKRNVYLTGFFRDTADFDPGSGNFNLISAGSLDIFISKLDSSGNLLWAKRIGGAGIDEGLSIVVNSSGQVYTTGRFKNTVDFDPGTPITNMISAGSSYDIFVSKLDANGKYVWAKRMGGIGTDIGYSIALDGSEKIYTTGHFETTADFDPSAATSNLISNGFSDVFISKLDASGNFVMAKSLGGTGEDYGFSLAVDGSDNIYSIGNFMSTADFDPGAGTFNLTSAGISDIFITKLDATGNFLWSKSMGSAGREEGRDIALDGLGNVYIVGFFNGTVDFDPGSGTTNLTSAGSSDLVISKFDISGNMIWAEGIGGTSYETPFSMVVDNAGNIYTTGYFAYISDFDPGPNVYNLTSVGGADAFILKLGLCDISIDKDPIDMNVKENENVQFSVISSNPNATFQWQQNIGSGYANMVDGSQYSGANNDTLMIKSVQLAQNNYQYRCFAKTTACSDTSSIAKLTVKTLGISNMELNRIRVFPNPAKNSVSVEAHDPSNLPYCFTDMAGREIMKGKLDQKISSIDISQLVEGLYILNIGNINKVSFKFIKL